MTDLTTSDPLGLAAIVAGVAILIGTVNQLLRILIEQLSKTATKSTNTSATDLEESALIRAIRQEIRDGMTGIRRVVRAELRERRRK